VTHEDAVATGGIGVNLPFQVVLSKSGRTIAVPADKSILEALHEAGVEVAYSCGQGICGTCETRVIEGEPDHRDEFLSEEERETNKTMMICCSRAKSARLVLDL
jgi:vanillate O-demethylase ferredoxin subunit